jgi:hypothetical protein
VIEKTRPKRAKKDPAYKDPLDKLKAQREKAAARKGMGKAAAAEKGESGSKLSAPSRKSERNTSMVDYTDTAEDDDGDPDDDDRGDRDHSDHRDAHDKHGAGGISSANTSGSSASSGPARRLNHLVSSCKRYFCVILILRLLSIAVDRHANARVPLPTTLELDDRPTTFTCGMEFRQSLITSLRAHTE